MALPDLTIDMDGVLCRPVSWFNLVISRDIRTAPDLTASEVGRSGRRFLDTPAGQALRYGWRPPLPRVREGLTELAGVRRLILLSGRSHLSREATERWLARRGLRDFFSEVLLNDRDVPNASFKLLIARERGVLEHVDDDGRVAYFLAQEDPRRTVYLISWLANARLPYPAGVRRVRDLLDAAREIQKAVPG